ncbi:DUF4166 domain-containing protein [Pseudalkalibacillus hwajinpoensis]|uniref:DUF4166 domain-containing protein n=1 Tax=Guptibacillus hwajinpoensis TaxID=208199 RepID=UPI001CFE0865|nr:DUF4166 domain-containing protein [Pseudalkalibacillus hwajinpoensis]
MSIYKKALGEHFYQLHPMLQKRYTFSKQHDFFGTGVMKKISGGPRWLYPIFYLGTKAKLLFPERGTNIPFQIRNTFRCGVDGKEQVHWQRMFSFGHKTRYFNALMTLDEKRHIIEDYLGEPALLYSDLAFQVNGDDGSMTIQSLNQRMVLGRKELPLPRFFQGLATVTERYLEDRESFYIHVTVKNPIIGTVFSYEGEFTSESES